MDFELLKPMVDLGTTGMVVAVLVWAITAIGKQMRAHAELSEVHIKAAREAEREHQVSFVKGVQEYLTETRMVERQHVAAVLASNERITTQTTEQSKHLVEIGRQNVELARELRGLADDVKQLKRE